MIMVPIETRLRGYGTNHNLLDASNRRTVKRPLMSKFLIIMWFNRADQKQQPSKVAEKQPHSRRPT